MIDASKINQFYLRKSYLCVISIWKRYILKVYLLTIHRRDKGISNAGPSIGRYLQYLFSYISPLKQFHLLFKETRLNFTLLTKFEYEQQIEVIK